MNNRERFRAAMDFQPTDRLCHVEWGFWNETWDRWQTEGLPENITNCRDYGQPGHDLFEYMDVIRFGYILGGQYYDPPFPREVLEETEDYRLERNERGVLAKVSKTSYSMPHFIDYPVKNRHDYEALKERLQPNIGRRYPKDWDTLVPIIRDQQEVLVCPHLDGFFGYPRELFGLVNLLTTLYDDPDLIEEIINDRVDFYIQLCEKGIAETKPDFAFVWEDMCFKNGPLLSPAAFRRFMLPAYKKLTRFLKDMGVKNIIVDSDGDVTQLISLWIEGGVTGLLPFEVRAGMDIVKVAEAYPKLQLLGGIDKHAIAEGHEAIDAELKRVLPALAKRGGFCVALDHWVPPTVSMQNFQYYAQKVREFKL